MKLKTVPILVTIGLILGSLVSPAYADENNWTTQDTVLESIHLGLSVVDWHQTREIAKSNGYWHEYNPYLGRHPSVRKVDDYMIACMILHPIVAVILPHPYRDWFQFFTIGLETGCVSMNYKIGIR